jgi:hypothetical protein
MKHKATRTPEGIDYLAVAISRMGNVEGAARKLNVPQSVVIGWLKHGLGHVKLGMVGKLARMSGIELELVATRTGPWKFNKQEKEWFEGKQPYPTISQTAEGTR